MMAASRALSILTLTGLLLIAMITGAMADPDAASHHAGAGGPAAADVPADRGTSSCAQGDLQPAHGADDEPASSVVLTVLSDGSTRELVVRLDAAELAACTFLAPARPALTRGSEDAEVTAATAAIATTAAEAAEVRGVVITAPQAAVSGSGTEVSRPSPTGAIPLAIGLALAASFGVGAATRAARTRGPGDRDQDGPSARPGAGGSARAAVA